MLMFIFFKKAEDFKKQGSSLPPINNNNSNKSQLTSNKLIFNEGDELSKSNLSFDLNYSSKL